MSKTIQCLVCPRMCTLQSHSIGACGVILAYDNLVVNPHEGKALFASTTTVEKIPLYHFFPGSNVLILWLLGCTLRCSFCPFKSISGSLKDSSLRSLDHDLILDIATRQRVEAFMINGGEPLIHTDWMEDLLVKARNLGFKIAIKSTGFISKNNIAKAVNLSDVILVEYVPHILNKYFDGLGLRVTIENYKYISKHDVHYEVLIPITHSVPTRSDLDLICEVFGGELYTPIHIYPYEEVSLSSLVKYRGYLVSKGFKYVYVYGDPTHKYAHTYCPKCGNIVLERRMGFLIRSLIDRGKCSHCGEPIYIRGEPKVLKWKYRMSMRDEIVW